MLQPTAKVDKLLFAPDLLELAPEVAIAKSQLPMLVFAFTENLPAHGQHADIIKSYADLAHSDLQIKRFDGVAFAPPRHAPVASHNVRVVSVAGDLFDLGHIDYGKRFALLPPH